MLPGLKWRLSLIIVLSICSFTYLMPSFFPQKNWLTEAKLKLGLDLQGGMHIVMGINPSDVLWESLKREAIGFEDYLKKKDLNFELSEKKAASGNDHQFTLKFPNPEMKTKALEFLNSDYSQSFRLTSEEETSLIIGFQKSRSDTILESGIDQALQVIRNRIDEFGVSEPVIQKSGNDRIAIQLPGLKDSERAKALIGQTAKLNFQIVSTAMSQADVAAIINEFETKSEDNKPEKFASFSDYASKVNEYAKEKLPKGTEIAFQREDKKATAVQGIKVLTNIPYLLESKVQVSGADLNDARVTVSQESNLPAVSLSFSPTGSKKFADVTGENVHKQMAIVLDGVVHSAPNINERIGGGSALISLGYGDYNSVLKEAKDIAIVLRAGSLPVKLELREERLVGPSLGKDSIEAGKKAITIGSLAVVIFMMIYYGISGLIANLALLMNMVMLIAVMTGFDATLTLPGIAGLALTVGMAVDGNIIIFERIREELRAGRDNSRAISLGFDRAFATIIDSNVTHAITAYILYIFGTGPIQGFAITLLIGIVTTVFTNVFVSHTLFGLYFKFSPQKLSI